MKINVNKAILLEVFGDVNKAVGTKTTIPILTSVKLVADKESNKLTLTGSNSDISIQATIPAELDGKQVLEIKEPGQVCLNAKFFGEIIRKAPTDTINIQVGDNFKTVLSSNGSKFNLNGLDAEDYPKLPTVNEKDGSSYKVQSKALKELIKKSIFAASTSESRPILTGANWMIADGILTNTVTDSHRLVKIPVEVEGDEESNVTLPGSSLKELEKILFDDETTVNVVITGNQVLFEVDSILFYSRLLEGSFPDTSRLIPEDHKTTIVLNRQNLFSAIDRATVLATSDKTNVIKIQSLDDKLLISSSNQEIGTVEEEVAYESYEGDALEISASAKYMKEMLNALAEDTVVFHFNGAMRPFTINNKEDENDLHLILPVRTY